jgi:hypothetical protein
LEGRRQDRHRQQRLRRRHRHRLAPRARPDLIATVYVAEATAPVSEINPVFAEVGRIVAEMV